MPYLVVMTFVIAMLFSPLMYGTYDFSDALLLTAGGWACYYLFRRWHSYREIKKMVRSFEAEFQEEHRFR